MRLIRMCILLLWTSAGGVFTLAQDDVFNSRLRINDQLKYIEICSPEQIEAFYSILDDVQAQADNIPKITSTRKLQVWVSVNNTWITDVLVPQIRDNCDGVRHLYLQLDRSVTRQITNQMFPTENEIPQDDTIAKIREILDADMVAIEAGEVSIGELLINKIATSKRDCTLEEALLFSGSIDEYENETFGLLTIPAADLRAIAEWAEEFEIWAEETWSMFHEQPCGETLTLIFWLETIAYGLPIDWLYYEEANTTLDSALGFVRDRAAVDPELIEERSREED